MCSKAKAALLVSAVLWVLAAMVWPGCATPSSPSYRESITLKLFTNQRADHLTAVSRDADQEARAKQYQFVRIEGYISPRQQSGTVPLKLYWNQERTDYLSTAAEKGEADAKADGYQFVRIEGYVYSTKQIGTVPLKQYWSLERQDFFLTASKLGQHETGAANYEFVRIEGYVMPSVDPR